jgi:hypothetical protein
VMFEFGDAGLGVATASVGFAMGFLRVALNNGSDASVGILHFQIANVHCTTNTLDVRFSVVRLLNAIRVWRSRLHSDAGCRTLTQIFGP